MTRRFVLGVLAALVLTGSSAQAQEMSMRPYLVQKVAGPYVNSFVPKYFFAQGLSFESQSYGFENAFLVVANVTADQHTSLAAQPDVLAIPLPLDDQIGAIALPGIQAKLEALNLPGNSVTAQMTGRQIVRRARKVIAFAQRFQELFPAALIFESGITLSTRLNELTTTQRQRLTTVSDALGLDRSGLTNTMTIRTALALLGDQLPNLTLSGEVF